MLRLYSLIPQLSPWPVDTGLIFQLNPAISVETVYINVITTAAANCCSSIIKFISKFAVRTSGCHNYNCHFCLPFHFKHPFDYNIREGGFFLSKKRASLGGSVKLYCDLPINLLFPYGFPAVNGGQIFRPRPVGDGRHIRYRRHGRTIVKTPEHPFHLVLAYLFVFG